MFSKKGGNQKVNKTSRANSMQENLTRIDDKPLKSQLKAMKKAFKQASTSSDKRLLNNNFEYTNQQNNQSGIDEESSEQLEQDQVHALNSELFTETIQNAFTLVNQQYQKLIDEKQKLTQTLSKIKGRKKYQNHLQQMKCLYKKWLKEMKELFSQYKDQLKLQFDQIQAQKQMVESKKTTKPEEKCEKLKKDIIQLKMQQIKLDLELQKRLKTIHKNKSRDLQMTIQNLKNNYNNERELENFYNRQLYQKKKTYIEMISETSKIIMKMNKKENLEISIGMNSYVMRLKYILYKIGTQYLAQSDRKKLRQNYRAWKYFKQIFQGILQTEDINFLAFQLQNEEFDLHFRSMFIDASFVNFRETYKNQNQKRIKIQQISYKPLSQLSIKRSHIYYQDGINRLEEMVQVLKKSWYIRFHLAYYIIDRQKVFKQINQKSSKKKNFQPKTNQYILNSVAKFIKNAKVYFIDYAMVAVNGITLTADPSKQYPIFINLFSFFEGKKISIGYFQSYTLFLLVHELAHSVIRNYDWLQSGESSNPYNFMNDNKKDRGLIFQHLLFGGAVQVYSQRDYQNVKDLLKLQHCPSYLNKNKNLSPINKVSYESHHSNIIQQYAEQKDFEEKKQKNLRDTEYLQRRNLQQGKQQKQIKSQKTLLNDFIKSYAHLQPKPSSQKSQIQIKIKGKKNNHESFKLNQQKFTQMEHIISTYGVRRLQTIKPNEKHLYMSLKVGNQIQSNSLLRPLNLCCGTHYK